MDGVCTHSWNYSSSASLSEDFCVLFIDADGDVSKLKWNISLRKFDNVYNVSLYLRLISCDVEATVNYTCSIWLEGKNYPLDEKKGEFTFTRQRPEIVWEHLKSVSQKYQPGCCHVPPKLFCEIRIIEVKSRFKVPNSTLSDDLGKLLDNEECNDVVFRVADREFRAHKAVLAARSPVFRAMFLQDKEETVNIQNITPEVFQEVLRFLYTGKVEGLENIAKELLVAANAYQLEEGLKAMCALSIRHSISTDNAIDTLIFADAHSAPLLKMFAKDFIEENDDLCKTSKWEDMLLSCPHLGIDL